MPEVSKERFGVTNLLLLTVHLFPLPLFYSFSPLLILGSKHRRFTAMMPVIVVGASRDDAPVVEGYFMTKCSEVRAKRSPCQRWVGGGHGLCRDDLMTRVGDAGEQLYGVRLRGETSFAARTRHFNDFVWVVRARCAGQGRDHSDTSRGLNARKIADTPAR